MDYKKKYEEAIIKLKKLFDRANNNHETLDLWFNNFANIFPELRESEDERIRQEIVSYLNQFREEGLRGVDITPWIAYLEKQKEQKPAEWSEEDDVMLDKVFCLINPGTKLTDDNADYCVELKQWIGSLRERLLKSLHPQSKQGWSEKDEKMLKYLEELLNYAFKNWSHFEGNAVNALSWLKSLPEKFNLQPKVEWSEEDEDKVDDICKLIEHATIIPRSGDDDTGIPPTRLNDKYKGELKAFVKSLRPQPHWKPTEEQMNKLNITIRCYENDWGVESAKPLNNLYEELEKL